MFAIEITEENLEKIAQNFTYLEAGSPSLAVYLGSEKTWYYISGWVSSYGSYPTWNVLPWLNLVSEYDYDPIKIQTDWDQIVRK